jgi:hypothetical protein
MRQWTEFKWFSIDSVKWMGIVNMVVNLVRQKGGILLSLSVLGYHNDCLPSSYSNEML